MHRSHLRRHIYHVAVAGEHGAVGCRRCKTALQQFLLHQLVVQVVGAELELLDVMNSHEHSYRGNRLQHLVFLLLECRLVLVREPAIALAGEVLAVDAELLPQPPRNLLLCTLKLSLLLLVDLRVVFEYFEELVKFADNIAGKIDCVQIDAIVELGAHQTTLCLDARTEEVPLDE